MDKRKSTFESAADVLQSLLTDGKSGLSLEFSRWQLWRKWPEVVGPTIGKHTVPVGLKSGTLWVWVKNSVWMQQMVFLSKPVKDKVNKYLGSDVVKFVRFTVDRKEVPDLASADPQMLEFLDAKASED